MTTEPQPETKVADKSENNPASSFSVVFPVICTLLGVGVTSGLTWMTAYQTSSSAEKSACILKYDQQESEIRAKSAAFLAAYGNIVSYLTVADKLTSKGMQDSAGPLFKSGFELVAYAPENLSFTTTELMLSLQDIFVDEIHDKDSPEHQKIEKDLFDRWTSEYSEYVASIRGNRKSCN